MHLYEEILNVEMDRPNFKRKILKMKILKDLEEKQTDVFPIGQQNYIDLTTKSIRNELKKDLILNFKMTDYFLFKRRLNKIQNHALG